MNVKQFNTWIIERFPSESQPTTGSGRGRTALGGGVVLLELVHEPGTPGGAFRENLAAGLRHQQRLLELRRPLSVALEQHRVSDG